MADWHYRLALWVLHWLIRSPILKTDRWDSNWNLPFLTNLRSFIDVWFLKNNTWYNSDGLGGASHWNWNRYLNSLCCMAGDRRSRHLGRIFPWLTYLRADAHAVLIRTCMGFYESCNYWHGPRHNCLIQIWSRSHYNQYIISSRV